jgi:hypothetical protein
MNLTSATTSSSYLVSMVVDGDAMSGTLGSPEYPNYLLDCSFSR